jgi:hypothetical protein
MDISCPIPVDYLKIMKYFLINCGWYTEKSRDFPLNY